jgi:hypothetical protein
VAAGFGSIGAAGVYRERWEMETAEGAEDAERPET